MKSNQVPDQSMLIEQREFLVPKWIEWGKLRDKEVTAVGRNMCRFTSAFLAKALGPGWRYEGGWTSLWAFSPQMAYCMTTAGFKALAI